MGFMIFGDVFMRKYPTIYDKSQNTMRFAKFLTIILYFYNFFGSASPIGFIDTKFITVVEWIWLAVAILIIMILIGLKIALHQLKKEARKHHKVNVHQGHYYVN